MSADRTSWERDELVTKSPVTADICFLSLPLVIPSDLFVDKKSSGVQTPAMQTAFALRCGTIVRNLRVTPVVR